MPIYSSQKTALKNSLPQQGEPNVAPRQNLSSCLLGQSKVLQRIVTGEHNMLTVDIKTTQSIPIILKKIYETPQIPLGPEIIEPVRVEKQYSVTYSGEYIIQLRKALWVLYQAGKDKEGNVIVDGFNPQSWLQPTFGLSTVHPGMIEDYLKGHNINDENYDIKLREIIRALQAQYNLDIDGIIGENTLLLIDQKLNDIENYDCYTGQLYYDVSRSKDLEQPVITRVYKQAKIYSQPDVSDPLMLKTQLSVNDKVHIIKEIFPELGQNQNWYYVQYDSGVGATSHKDNRSFGYMRGWNILSLKSMPDSEAILFKIPALLSGGTIFKIIKDKYYDQSIPSPITGTTAAANGFGTEIWTERPTPGVFNLTYYRRLKQYNTFKFYVNLVLFANNPKLGNHSGDPSVYLDTAGATLHDPVVLKQLIDGVQASANPANNPDDDWDNSPGIDNYNYFLNYLENNNPNSQWDEDLSETNQIVVKKDYWMWLPGIDFADRLYLYVTNHQSKLSNYHNQIRNAIQTKWPRGFGVEIEGRIGATFGIPIRVELGGGVWLYRKYTESDDDVTMVIRKFGTVQAGVDIGVGAGYYVGSGNSKDKGNKIGAMLEARAQGHGRFECFTEYEFPLYDITSTEAIGRRDLSSIALLTSLAGTGSVALEFAAVEFTKAFSDYNIDPMNYLSKMELRYVAEAQGSGGAMLGIDTSDGNDHGYWTDFDNNNQVPNSGNSTPWVVDKLMSLIYVGAGINVGANLTLGYEYMATFDDQSFDKRTGARVPKSITQAVTTNVGLFYTASASAFTFGVSSNLSPYIGMKLTQSYTRETPDPSNAIGVDFFDPKVDKFENNSILPKISFFAGNGNWDFYDGSSSEFGLRLKGNTYTPANLADAINSVEYIYIKKRFRLLSFSTSALKDVDDVQKRLKSFFKKNQFAQFGVKAGAFLDIEARITFGDFLNIMTTLEDIFDEIKNILITNGMSNPNWFDVLVSIASYANLFNSEKISADLKKLVHQILSSFKIQHFGFHSEMGFGGGAGLRAAAGYKIAIDLQAALSLTYDHVFYENGLPLIHNIITDNLSYRLMEELNFKILNLTDQKQLNHWQAMLEFSGDEKNKNN
jgi:peptidoglycan hydrolase-like protein with peptidoglycan-binding domain